MKLHMVSLGCARNLVDSEIMLGRLTDAGWILTRDPADAHTIIVNTCSFITSAADESIDTILEMAEHKKKGRCRRLIVAGCLPERYREKIAAALPEVDCFLGTGAFDQIRSAAADGAVKCQLPDPDNLPVQDADTPRVLGTAPIAYLKIAEGCSRHCTYCIIPRLRGRQKSRTIPAIVAEAERLIAAGARELILVAQDSTFYGRDLQPESSLDRLLQRLAALSESTWFRVLYGHPESIDAQTVRTMATYPNICRYFDIPIQHASDRILKRMGRHYSADDLSRLFERIRTLAPDACLRTTVIVGFPGETDRDFDRLLTWVRSMRFDHLGAFTYSDASDLPAHRLGDHVPEDVAQHRYDRLMAAQREISLAHNQARLGQVVSVLLEEAPEDGLFMGRTAFQAPEVDGITYVHTDATRCGKLAVGDFTAVKIVDALDYDLVGEAV